MSKFHARVFDLDTGEVFDLGISENLDLLEATTSARQRLEGAGLKLMPPLVLEVVREGARPFDLKWRNRYMEAQSKGRLVKKEPSLVAEDALEHVDKKVNVEEVA